jgi:hypothetical protein
MGRHDRRHARRRPGNFVCFDRFWLHRRYCFSGHGFGIGPAAGRLATDLLTGDPPIVDPTPFRLDRSLGGSRSQPKIDR